MKSLKFLTGQQKICYLFSKIKKKSHLNEHVWNLVTNHGSRSFYGWQMQALVAQR